MADSLNDTLYERARAYCHDNDVASLRQIFTDQNLDTEHKFENGRTLLHEACYLKNSQIISLLIDLGANVNAVNKNGTTPLMYAKTNIQREQYEILDYLVSKGALIDIKDKFDKTVIDYIAEQDNQDLLLYFKEQLSKINKLV